MSARLKLVVNKPHGRPPAVPFGSTRSQRRVQEIAWMIYISEGYLANLEHALRLNASNMTGADKAEARVSIARAKQNVWDLRGMLS